MMTVSRLSVARRATALVVAATAVTAGVAGAQVRSAVSALGDALGVSGTLRAGYWSSTRDLDAIDPRFNGIVWVKATRDVAPTLSYYVEGWAALRGPPDDSHTAGELREGYVDLSLGRLDVRMGRQIVAWGRADGINPTDNLTPRDFTILVPDDADRRVGTTGLRARWYQGDLSLSALWLPEFQPNRVSLPAPPHGVVFREPYDRWPSETWALRAERTGGAMDWSLSFMRGPDLQPDLRVGAVNGGPLVVNLDHHRVWVAGADAATNVGRFGLRAEAAYTGTRDESGRDPFTKNHNLFVVLGADRTLGTTLNVNAQYLFRYVRDFSEAPRGASIESAIALQGAVLSSQIARVQHGVTTRVRNTWHNETLAAELAAVAYFGPRGLVLTPKTSYAVNDHWTVVIGGEIYRGDSRSVPGLLRTNSVGYGEIRLGF